jgi:hypothetical protein
MWKSRRENGAGGLPMSRRGFFERVGDGTYGAALAYLLGADLAGGSGPSAAESPASPPHRGTSAFDLKPRAAHFPPRARAVIHLVMQGGPSQVDLFDPKPLLEKHAGQPFSKQDLANTDVEPGTAGGLLPSPFRFARHGQSGIWLSELLPHLAQQVDQIAVIRSMFTTHPNHEPALYKLQSGRMQSGLPCLGSWVVYGLGSENQNLPAYVVLADPVARLPTNGVQNWQAGFLPPLYQGARLRSVGSPVLNLRPETEEPPEIVRMERDLLSRLDGMHRRQRPGEPWLDARIASYELAARMQLQAHEALDLAKETKNTLEMYGVGEARTDNFARRCVMARRLVERGVRFIQLYTAGQIWDSHGSLAAGLRAACEQTDKPVAALLQDLRQRGLLDSTLVLWGGEFGRLPIAELPADKDLTKVGRGHGPHGFSVWMAGGGIQGGIVHGATDEIGLAAVEGRVSVTDWHATILHLLGLDHVRLVFDRNGFKEKLTSTFPARVVQEVLA